MLKVMIKINYKQWILDVWHRQTWFGYTYIVMSMDWNTDGPFGKWYKNDSTFIKSLNEWEDEHKNDKN